MIDLLYLVGLGLIVGVGLYGAWKFTAAIVDLLDFAQDEIDGSSSSSAFPTGPSRNPTEKDY